MKKLLVCFLLLMAVCTSAFANETDMAIKESKLDTKRWVPIVVLPGTKMIVLFDSQDVRNTGSGQLETVMCQYSSGGTDCSYPVCKEKKLEMTRHYHYMKIEFDTKAREMTTKSFEARDKDNRRVVAMEIPPGQYLRSPIPPNSVLESMMLKAQGYARGQAAKNKTEPSSAAAPLNRISLGKIYLGQPFKEVAATYGPPVSQTVAADGTVTVYDLVKPGPTYFTVWVKNSGEQPVLGVFIQGNVNLATNAGIKLGSTLDEVERAYGRPVMAKTIREMFIPVDGQYKNHEFLFRTTYLLDETGRCYLEINKGRGNTVEAISLKTAEKPIRIIDPLTTRFAITKEDLNVGGIYFGQKVSEIVARYGQPVKTVPRAPKGLDYVFSGEAGQFTVSPEFSSSEGEIVKGMIIKEGCGLATSRGIRIGATREEVKAVYGSPDRESMNFISYMVLRPETISGSVVYNPVILVFNINEADKVKSIEFWCD